MGRACLPPSPLTVFLCVLHVARQVRGVLSRTDREKNIHSIVLELEAFIYIKSCKYLLYPLTPWDHLV